MKHSNTNKIHIEVDANVTKQCGQKGGIFPFCGIFGPKGGTDF